MRKNVFLYIVFTLFVLQNLSVMAATQQQKAVQKTKKVVEKKTQEPKKVMEKTFALIKPSGMPIADEIKSIIKLHGLKIIRSKKMIMSEELFDKLYFVHKDKQFFNDLKASIVNKEVEAMVLYGDRAVERYRTAVTFIRNKYAAILDKTANAVHGSDSSDRAKEEICIFFKTECDN